MNTTEAVKTRQANESTPPDETRRSKDLRERIEQWGLLGLLVLLFTICVLTIPAFRSWGTATSMIGSQAIVLLLALIATIVFRAGDFDLSIAAVMVGSACIIAEMSQRGYPPLAAVPTALAFGIIVGVVNGYLVVKIGVDSFVTTLGVFTAVTGIGYWVTAQQVIGGIPEFYVTVARTRFLDLPLVAWYAWVLVVLLWYIYERTPLGRYILFIGGNRDAARLAGLPVSRIRMAAFIASGGLSALTGIFLVGYLGAMDPGIGAQYLLAPFAAVFLGATAVTVGRFNALGTVIALYLLMVGITALQLLGAQPWVSSVFNGAALVLAVTVAKLASRNRTS